MGISQIEFVKQSLVPLLVAYLHYHVWEFVLKCYIIDSWNTVWQIGNLRRLLSSQKQIHFYEEFLHVFMKERWIT